MQRQPARAALVGEFVHALHRLRCQAGDPPYREMQEAVHYSTAALQRVQSGKEVPSRPSTLAFVQACLGDVKFWGKQYLALKNAMRTNTVVRFYPWPEADISLQSIGSGRDFANEMHRLKEQSGLQLAEISSKIAEAVAAHKTGFRHTSIQTLSDLCNPRQVSLPRATTVRGFLMSIGTVEEGIDRWLELLDDLATNRRRQSNDNECC